LRERKQKLGLGNAKSLAFASEGERRWSGRWRDRRNIGGMGKQIDDKERAERILLGVKSRRLTYRALLKSKEIHR